MKRTLTLFLLFSCILAAAQITLRVNTNINLPKDTLESNKLTSSLNKFLESAQGPNEENKYVFEGEKLETFVLLDEISGIKKSPGFKDDAFNKPYLTNIVLLKDSNYLIQVSYIGIKEDVAWLRASFEFIAHKVNNGFVFSSPLLKNTEHWKILKAGNNNFHYQNSINMAMVKEVGKLTSLFDKKLKCPSVISDYYCTDNITDLQKLVGVQYKSDYNGRTKGVWGSMSGNRKIIVLGNNNASFDEFDPHDLFHERLSLIVSRSKVNKPVDEGCAYLYGGSWGLTWSEIFKAFKEQIAYDKNVNWLEIKETSVYFKTKGFNNSADYIVNALLVRKIEKEKGFSGVWELLNVGPVEKGNEKYYQTLEKLTGITKSNYNAKIWELIKSEK